MTVNELLKIINDFIDDPRVNSEVSNDYSDRLEGLILIPRNTSELEQIVIINSLDNYDVMHYE